MTEPSQLMPKVVIASTLAVAAIALTTWAAGVGVGHHHQAGLALKPACATFADAASDPAATSGMARVSGGSFIMGSDKHHPEERPARSATVGDFWIDRHEVTNAQFAAFIAATGYVTVAERPVDPKKYAGAPPDMVKPGSIVFHKPTGVVDLVDQRQWWAYVPGASWRHPEGPESSIDARMTHPVVHVTFEDALAYARWRGNDLPTEAEWEFAARGGLSAKEFTWGDEKLPGGQWQANAWQGVFPLSNQIADGYEGTAPAGCYAPNGYGLYDMAGNVWEITADDYRDGRGAQKDMKVIKGGSHLCADNFCYRYRPAARQPASIDVGASHIGFRTIRRIEAVEPPG